MSDKITILIIIAGSARGHTRQNLFDRDAVTGTVAAIYQSYVFLKQRKNESRAESSI